MEPTEHNRRAWEEAHRRPPEEGLPARVRERLPDVDGRHVLHLGCPNADSAAELAQLGALVTGICASEAELAAARAAAPDAVLVHARADALPLELRRARFDLVYSAAGTLAAVRDLDGWATGIAAALRPGGGLVLHDAHPVLRSLDAALRWRDDYFGDGDGWRLGQVVTALVRAGLTLHRVEELPNVGARRQDPRVPSELVVLAVRASA